MPHLRYSLITPTESPNIKKSESSEKREFLFYFYKKTKFTNKLM